MKCMQSEIAWDCMFAVIMTFRLLPVVCSTNSIAPSCSDWLYYSWLATLAILRRVAAIAAMLTANASWLCTCLLSAWDAVDMLWNQLLPEQIMPVVMMALVVVAVDCQHRRLKQSILVAAFAIAACMAYPFIQLCWYCVLDLVPPWLIVAETVLMALLAMHGATQAKSTASMVRHIINSILFLVVAALLYLPSATYTNLWSSNIIDTSLSHDTIMSLYNSSHVPRPLFEENYRLCLQRPVATYFYTFMTAVSDLVWEKTDCELDEIVEQLTDHVMMLMTNGYWLCAGWTELMGELIPTQSFSLTENVCVLYSTWF